MGNYDPYRPEVLGNAWAPIRDEDIVFAPTARSTELGYTFTNALAAVPFDIDQARFYIHDLPDGPTDVETYTAAVYFGGTERSSGPLQRLIIPVTGTHVSGVGVMVSGTSSTVTALADPSDGRYISFNAPGLNSTSALYAYFGVSQYIQELANKRILGVDLLYSISGQWLEYYAAANNPTGNSIQVVNNGAIFAPELAIPYGEFNTLSPTLGRKRLGEINYYATATHPTATSARYPWYINGLRKFDLTNTPGVPNIRIRVPLQNAVTSLTVNALNLHYLALEVFYVEEHRIFVGGKSFGGSSTLSQPFTIGANGIEMSSSYIIADFPYVMGSFASGNYIVTLSIADPGDSTLFQKGVAPNVNGLRQLYSIGTQTGVRINLPFPLDRTAVGKVFTSEFTNILPQLTLHGYNSGVITNHYDIHPYGRQAQIPVYGAVAGFAQISTTAIQQIYSDGANGQTYPQFRFYARRFGNTTTPLIISSPTYSGAGTMSITPDEFDALEPEDGIIDGWKEITLRWPTPPTIANGDNPTVKWTANAELSSDRWEILGAVAPAYSGFPGNLKNAPSGISVGNATYGTPYSGAQISLTWSPPYITGTKVDSWSDATALWSQDPWDITNLELIPEVQELETVDPTCEYSTCVPTSLDYNIIAWTPITGSSFSAMAGEGNVVNGWSGIPPNAGWDIITGAVSDFSVDDNVGGQIRVSGSTVPDRHIILMDNVYAKDVDVSFDMKIPVDITRLTGNIGILGGAVARYDPVTNNGYYLTVNLFITAADPNQQSMTLGFKRVTGGAPIVIDGAEIKNVTPAGDSFYRIRFQVTDRSQRAKIWYASQPEPEGWLIQTYDGTYTNAGYVGALAYTSLAGSSVPYTLSFRNFYSQPFGFGAYELQRTDTVDNEYKTIMTSENAYTYYFNDYEARVGEMTSYRMRARNTYNFYGSWTTPVTGTIASPGVTGADTGILIFTSNENQEGLYNLAYSMSWESMTAEGFSWPEATTVQLRRMFRRNFNVAFKPLERGGEVFTRNMLVNATGIPPVVKARGFRDLRDMAWQDVSYICVRDETGERWFAAVMIPEGTVNRMSSLDNARLSIAAVQIVETSENPSEVDLT